MQYQLIVQYWHVVAHHVPITVLNSQSEWRGMCAAVCMISHPMIMAAGIHRVAAGSMVGSCMKLHGVVRDSVG